MGRVESLEGGTAEEVPECGNPASPRPSDLLRDLCASCGRCCRWAVAFYPVHPDPIYREPFLEWARTRGFLRAMDKDRSGWEAWLIPSVCPKLKDNLCSIHESKPQVCREWEPWDFPEAARPPIDCAWLAIGREV